MNSLKKNYKCPFCDKTFTKQSWYDKHMCDKKKRFLDRNNIFVIKGHRLFNHWQTKAKLLKRGKTKTMEEFVKSPFYKIFVALAEYTTQTYVVSAYKYVDWIVEHGIPERDWFLPSKLENYRRYLRQHEDPVEQAKTTFQNIRLWAEENEAPYLAFFTHIRPGIAVEMVRSGRLSPWVLFHFDPAVIDLLPRIHAKPDLFHELDDLVNIDYWIKKEETDTDRVEELVAFCNEKFRIDG